MDVLYIFKENAVNDSAELRYSLRSLQNFRHGKVVIAGEKPSWVKNVTYIPVDQSSSKQDNGRRNLEAAIKSGVLPNEFLLMNDDFYIVNKLQEIPNLHHGNMSKLIKAYRKRYPEGSPYIETMEALHSQLQKENTIDPISYELHTPMVFDVQKIERMYNSLGEDRVYQFRSRYGNFYNLYGEEAADVKLFNNCKNNPAAYNENPIRYMESSTFISTTGGSFNHGIPGRFLRQRFVSPSQYE